MKRTLLLAPLVLAGCLFSQTRFSPPQAPVGFEVVQYDVNSFTVDRTTTPPTLRAKGGPTPNIRRTVLTPAAGTLSFNLSDGSFQASTLHYYLNGVLQAPIIDYTVSGVTITNTAVRGASQLGDIIQFEYQY